MVLADMKLAGTIPTDVVLFNIDSKSEVNGKQSKGQIKEGTGVVELLDLTATSADFTEKDIIDRYKKMIDCFINYLQKNGLLK